MIEFHDDMISPKTWPYDHVFGAECSNEYVFNATARKLITNALDGYNTVLFMYGQTSSGKHSPSLPLLPSSSLYPFFMTMKLSLGKTFTLFGSKEVAGLVDHTLREVYNSINNSVDTEYVVKMIFVELYNEELKVS